MDGVLEERGLASVMLTGNNFSPQQRLAQQVIAVVSSSISIIAGAVSLYWFFRMRTNFRHHLIILLICSDLLKAIWYFIPAIVGLVGKTTTGNFCQATGFFLAVGIESSDYAILVIAIHSALCIFKPRTSLGEAGLFNLRYAVYALWIIIPVIMASLGLMQGGVYTGQGAFCYLPIRPFWYRLGLAWIPRYLIFLTICILYVRIYWFVSGKFKQFDLDSEGSHKQPSDHRTFNSVSSPRPDPTRLVSTGAWADGGIGGVSSATGSISQPNTPIAARLTDEKGKEEEATRQTSDSPAWENYTFGSSRWPIPPLEEEDLAPVPANRASQVRPSPSSLDETAATGASPTSVTLAQALSETGPESVTTPSSATRLTLPSPIHPARELPPPTQQPPRPTLRPKLPERPNSQYVTAEGMRVRHTAIKRQLRFLFVYPVFYLISWLVPLAQHLSLYWDNIAAHPIFGLSCAATFFLALQCAIDAFIFSTRETPWRYVRRESGSNRDSEAATAVDDSDPAMSGRWHFWRRKHERTNTNDTKNTKVEKAEPLTQSSESQQHHNHHGHPSSPASRFFSTLSFKTSSSSRSDPGSHQQQQQHSNKQPSSNRNSRSVLSLPIRTDTARTGGRGKTKGEMLAEARVAKRRRDMEASHAQEGRVALEKKRKMSFARREGRDRAWWEVEGRRRKDSVLLGTDSKDCKDSKEGGSPSPGPKERETRQDGRSGSVSASSPPAPAGDSITAAAGEGGETGAAVEAPLANVGSAGSARRKSRDGGDDESHMPTLTEEA